jgi:hypothetical protein
MRIGKPPLYRKVNTLARGVHHRFGGDFRHQRQGKPEADPEDMRSAMHGKKQRGLDYTPLFRFLLSKIGQDWTAVYSEARSRLDRDEPIFWLVARGKEDQRELVRIGESSFYSGLFVDETNILRQVNPSLAAVDVPVTCTCCTYTLNGVEVPKPENISA